jgi:hypothetical protein
MSYTMYGCALQGFSQPYAHAIPEEALTQLALTAGLARTINTPCAVIVKPCAVIITPCALIMCSNNRNPVQ